MSLRLEADGERLTAYLEGEIDHHTAKDLREEIDSNASRLKPEQLLLDFREVTFMDSSGIGVLIGRSRNLSFSGGQVVATNLSPRVKQIFRISGLQRLITIVPSDQENQKSEV